MEDGLQIKEEIKLKVYSKIVTSIKEYLNTDDDFELSDETPLIGDGKALDSMNLVELCLVLEDLAFDLGFEFDWTSDSAMSKSMSMFRTAGSLADEFFQQMKSKKW